MQTYTDSDESGHSYSTQYIGHRLPSSLYVDINHSTQGTHPSEHGTTAWYDASISQLTKDRAAHRLMPMQDTKRTVRLSDSCRQVNGLSRSGYPKVFNIVRKHPEPMESIDSSLLERCEGEQRSL